MWSSQQVTALDRVGNWLRRRDKPFFQLAGYAGTGKTTLARHLASSVDGPVYFAALTGKAAHVLSKTGAPNVSTIHKLIYKPKDKSQQRLRALELERAELRTQNPLPKVLLEKIDKAIQQEKDNLHRPAFALQSEDECVLRNAALVVIDEYSMVGQQQGDDLLSFGVPVLALGDPGQLPPIRERCFFPDEPDMLLTEIHRQAADNPIIWMSKEVREGRSLQRGAYGEAGLVVGYGELSREAVAEHVLAADQLLVGRNATRASSNARIRELKGFSSKYPQRGDKLVCLRNNHEIGLLNGQIWYATKDAMDVGDSLALELRSEDDEGVTASVLAHSCYFESGKPPEFWARKDVEEFDYGDALTVHKAQGSQWGKVTLLDEWYGTDRAKWLYTGITRAAQRLVVVQM